MTSLFHRQWKAINEMALRIHSASDKDELITLAIEDLPSAIDSCWAAWNEHDDLIQLNTIHATKEYDPTIRKLLPLVNQLMDSHPVIEGLELAGNLELKDGVFSLTDFKSMRELRKVPMWWEVYRHVESRQQLVSQFMVHGQHGVTLTVNSDMEFTDEQKLMVSHLKDHFMVACRKFLREDLSLKTASSLFKSAQPTRRERETLPHLLAGKTNPEIAIILGISPRTVEKHVSSILEKTGAENRFALFAMLGQGED